MRQLRELWQLYARREAMAAAVAVFHSVSDGKMVLHLEPAEDGGYIVTPPLDPELVTEAETVEESFEMARDAAQALKLARTKLRRKL